MYKQSPSLHVRLAKNIFANKLGQTNCHVAISPGRTRARSNDDSFLRSMPACVAFTKNGVLIGNGRYDATKNPQG